MLIEANDRILFQGDSITDAGRDPNRIPLGVGYAYMAASLFSARFPEFNVTFMNRGISGNRVKDLEARWDQDCLELKPTILSIMIGINDTWRRFDRSDPTSVESYKGGYARLLTRVKKALPETRLILLEPFLLPVLPGQESWREDLDPKIQAAREVAREFKTLYVALDGLFAQASAKREPSFWAPDGVHPSGAGHAFIAEAWLKAVGAEKNP